LKLVLFNIANIIFADIHTVAVIKANEAYQNISIGLKDAIDAFNSLIHVPVLIIDEEMNKVS